MSKLTEFDTRLGKAVREQRILCGKSQQDVGNALGITFQQVQKNERGINRITVGRLVEIAKLFGTTPAALIAKALGEEARAGDDAMTRQSLALIQHFHKLAPDQRHALVVFARTLTVARDM